MNDAVVMQALESARGGSGWNPLGAFEIVFDRPLDLDAFRRAVEGGRGDLRLWMIEVETGPDFARFLLRGYQVAELLVEGEDGNGIPGGLAYPKDAAPLQALSRLFAGLDVFPVALVEVAA